MSYYTPLYVLCRAALSLYLLSSAAIGQAEDVQRARASMLFGDVQGLTPSLSAYVLLQKSRTETGSVVRNLVTERVWAEAVSAQPYPIASSRAPNATVDGLWPAGGGLPMDSLSLRLAAIAQLAPVDRQKTQQLLETLTLPDIHNISCSEPYMPDLTAFFVSLSKILPQAYGTEPRDAGYRTAFILRLLGQSTSSLTLAGAISLFIRDDISTSDLQVLVSTYADRLDAVIDGDPEFTVAMISYQLPQKVTQLARLLAARQLPMTALLQAYSRYVTRNQSRRCADWWQVHQRLRRLPLHDYVTQFNGLLDNLEGSGAISRDAVQRIARLSVSELTVFKGHTAQQLPFATDAGKSLLTQLREATSDANTATTIETEILLTQIRHYCNDAVRHSSNRRAALVETVHLHQQLLDASPEQEYLNVLQSFVSFLADLWQPDVEAATAYYLEKLILQTESSGAKPDRNARWGAIKSALRDAPMSVRTFAHFLMTEAVGARRDDR